MAAEAEKLTIAEAAAAMKTTSLNVMMHIKRGLLVGQEIAALKEHVPNAEGRIAAIYRDG